MRRTRRSLILLAAAVFALLAPAPAPAQQLLGTPGTSGDQLIFFYDATASRTPFLVVSNLAPGALTLEIAWYSQDLSRRLATQFEVIESAGNRIFDPSALPAVKGNAGLAVVTPVRGTGDAIPIVPPALPGFAGGALFGATRSPTSPATAPSARARSPGSPSTRAAIARQQARSSTARRCASSASRRRFSWSRSTSIRGVPGSSIA